MYIRPHFTSPSPCEIERAAPSTHRMQQLVHKGASSPAENPGGLELAEKQMWQGLSHGQENKGPCIPAEPVCSLRARKNPGSLLMVTPEKQP